MPKKSELRIAFMGTPEFALPSLAMLEKEGYRVVLCVTQPDRPKGRGHKLIPPPVKEWAQQRNIPVLQCEKLSREGVDELLSYEPNLFITAAFGQILSRELLAIPPYGCINVHASLLPKYRGAAPIEWSVINGEKETGVTTMYTVYELDAGDILEAQAVEITPEITGGQLREELSFVGAEVLKKTLEKLCDGTLVRTPQKEEEATVCPMFKKGFGSIDFSLSCREIVNLTRGLDPAPGAYAMAGENRVRIYKCRQINEETAAQTGTILQADPKAGLWVQGGDGVLEILELQWPGSKRMEAKAFLRGRALGTEKLS